MSSSRQAPAPTLGPAPSLHIDQIVTAALRVIDRKGVPGLTMRALAEELGVAVMTLYNYVRTKDELLDRIAHAALHTPETAPDTSQRWTDQLAAAVREIVTGLTERPGAFAILIAGKAPESVLNPLRENILGILRGAGLEDAAAVRAGQVLNAYAIGFALSERVRSLGPTSLNQLDPASAQDYPNLAAVQHVFPSHVTNDAFEHGLQVLLASLAAEVEHRPRKRRGPASAGAGTRTPAGPPGSRS